MDEVRELDRQILIWDRLAIGGVAVAVALFLALIGIVMWVRISSSRARMIIGGYVAVTSVGSAAYFAFYIWSMLQL